MAGRNDGTDRAGALDATTRQRLVGLVAAHGPNPQRWPADARALAVLMENAVGRVELEAGSALDDLLSKISPAEIPEGLRARLIQDFERVSQAKGRFQRLNTTADRIGEFIWPGAPWWKPACALTISLVIGLSAGFLATTPFLDRRGEERTTVVLSDSGVDLDQDDQE